MRWFRRRQRDCPGYRIPLRWFILVSLVVFVIVFGFALHEYIARSMTGAFIGTVELVGGLRAGANLAVEGLGSELTRRGEVMATNPQVGDLLIEAARMSRDDSPVARGESRRLRGELAMALWAGGRGFKANMLNEGRHVAVYLPGDPTPWLRLDLPRPEGGPAGFAIADTTSPPFASGYNDLLIQDAFRSGEAQIGFVIAPDYSGLRSVVPVFDVMDADEERVIGVIELGVDMSTVFQRIEQATHLFFSCESALLLRKDYARDHASDDFVARKPELRIGNEDYFVVLGDSTPLRALADTSEFHTMFAEEDRGPFDFSKAMHDEQAEREKARKTFRFIDRARGSLTMCLDRLYGIQPLPIFITPAHGAAPDAAGHEERGPVASILVWAEFPEIYNELVSSLRGHLVHAGMIYLVLVVCLFFVFRQGRKKLQRLIDEQAQELHKAEKSFQRLYENALLGIFQARVGHGFEAINPAGARILGYDSPEKALGIDALDQTLYVQAEDRFVWLKALRQQGALSNYELRIRRADGEARWLLLNARITRNDAGEELIEGFAFDITAERRAREELTLSEERLQLALEVAGADMWEIDTRSWDYVTPPVRLYEKLGYPPEQTPRSVLDEALFCHPDDYALARKAVGRHLRRETDRFYSEMRVRAASGEWVWIALHGKVLRREDSDVATTLLGLSMDIDERKRAEEEVQRGEAKFRRIIETASEGFLFADPDFVIQEVNAAMLRLLGYTREELLHRHPREFACDETRACIMGRAGVDESGAFESVCVAKDGRRIPMLVNSSHLRDDKGEIIGHVSFLTDITEWKKAEEAMRQARAAAEEASRAKSDFLARMSHEIRTPLNAITGMTMLALETELTARQHDYLSKISVSADSLLRIVNDILDFAKIEAGKLDIEHVEFQLEDVLGNLSNIIALKAEEKNLEILFRTAPDVPHALVGDPHRLTQILVNLAGNAVKFTEQGEVVVSAQLVRELGDEVELGFSIRDTGIGLDAEALERLFQPFQQADGSITRRYGGTGLGLAISKRLVEMMHGKLAAHSVPGKGSVFSFTVQLGSKPCEEDRCYHPPGDLRGLRVLLVDDNPTALDILKETLESFSFRVGVADSGVAALAELDRAQQAGTAYRLLILDQHMPGWDGIETLARIATRFEYTSLPRLLMVGAFGGEDIAARARAVGVTGFVLKPANRSLLFDSIMEAFGKEIARRTRSMSAFTGRRESLQRIRGARVLVVEDNAINRQVATELLQRAGLVVDTAPDGSHGVEMACNGEYDVVLMDIQMPDMDGYETTRRIRERGIATPIIAMTAHAMAGDRDRSLHEGMVAHVTKPVDPGELFRVLLEWIPPGQRPEPRTEMPLLAVDESAASSLPDVAGVDTAVGLERVGGNLDLYRKLLHDFRQDHGNDATLVTEALEAGDRALARRLVHSMKSVAGTIGAGRLATAAAGLEALLAGEEQASGAPELAEFLEALNALLDALATLPPLLPQSQPVQEGSLEELAAGLRKLLEHLSKHRAGKANKAWEQLRTRDWPLFLNTDIMALGRLVAEYRFDEAEPLTRDLIQRCESRIS